MAANKKDETTGPRKSRAGHTAWPVDQQRNLQKGNHHHSETKAGTSVGWTNAGVKWLNQKKAANMALVTARKEVATRRTKPNLLTSTKEQAGGTLERSFMPLTLCQQNQGRNSLSRLAYLPFNAKDLWAANLPTVPCPNRWRFHTLVPTSKSTHWVRDNAQFNNPMR